MRPRDPRLEPFRAAVLEALRQAVDELGRPAGVGEVYDRLEEHRYYSGVAPALDQVGVRVSSHPHRWAPPEWRAP